MLNVQRYNEYIKRNKQAQNRNKSQVTISDDRVEIIRYSVYY